MTLTCAFVGTTAPHKAAATSEEMEDKGFKGPQSNNSALRCTTMRCLLVKPKSDDTLPKSLLEEIMCLRDQPSLFLYEMITTEGLHFFQRFQQLKLQVSVR